MKKFMIIALAAMFTATAFAQNPDALKQIKKAKTFDEAQALIKANESTMSAAENAQAYNKLVDFAYKNVSDAQTTIQTNAAMEQMGQKTENKVDMNAFYNDLYVALSNALVCDKYDAQPNDKGKVAPKFRKANADRLYNVRPSIVNGGQEAQTANDNVKAAEYYGIYVATGVSDLFKEPIANAAKNDPNGVGDPYLSEVARVAAICAFQQNQTAKALQYADVVMQDPSAEKQKEGLQLKMYFLEKDLKTHEDSVACLGHIKQLYDKYPSDPDVFSQLAQWYSNLGYKDKQVELIKNRLQTDPGNFTAWAMLGQNDMNDQKYDEAIENFKKATDCNVEDPKQKALVLTYIGFCYNAKAAACDKFNDQLELLKQAIPYLEQAREIDPERERANWAYPLHQCYYYVNGENDPKTKELDDLLNN